MSAPTPPGSPGTAEPSAAWEAGQLEPPGEPGEGASGLQPEPPGAQLAPCLAAELAGAEEPARPREQVLVAPGPVVGRQLAGEALPLEQEEVAA